MGSIVRSELITTVITHILFIVRAEFRTFCKICKFEDQSWKQWKQLNTRIKKFLNHVVNLEFLFFQLSATLKFGGSANLNHERPSTKLLYSEDKKGNSTRLILMEIAYARSSEIKDQKFHRVRYFETFSTLNLRIQCFRHTKIEAGILQL